MENKDSDKIESRGVNCLEDCINNSEFLKAYFRKMDKYPLWDGDIFVYEKNKGLQQRGRVPVQIKTTTTKKITAKSQVFPIKREELEIYKTDGGVLYFLICIKNEQFTIYYSALTQFIINNYLESNNKQKISVTLQVFPKDDISKYTNLIIEFFAERHVMPGKTEYSLNDLTKLRDDGFDFLSVQISTIGYKNPLDRVFDLPVYLHASKITPRTETPLGLVTIKRLVNANTNLPVKINNKIFYSIFTLSIEKNKNIFSFSRNLQITLSPISDDKYSFNLQFNLSGSLTVRIADLDFITSFFKYKTICLGDIEECFPVTEEVWDNLNPSFTVDIMKNYLLYYMDVKETFDILNIKKELDFSCLDEKGNDNLRLLIASIKNNQLLNLNHHEQNVLQKLKIGNLLIKLILSKQNDGKYMVVNYFAANLMCYYQDPLDVGEEIPVSPFVNMEIDEFKTLSNINYDKLYDSFLHLPNSEPLFGLTAQMVHNMLSAYDSMDIKDNELLAFSLKLSEWLLTKDENYKNCWIINKLQTLRRERELTDEEKSLLLEIVASEKDNLILTETYILLENSTMAKKHYENLSSKEKTDFNSYPINVFKILTAIDT